MHQSTSQNVAPTSLTTRERASLRRRHSKVVRRVSDPVGQLVFGTLAELWEVKSDL